jgi:hypothetical protein
VPIVCLCVASLPRAATPVPTILDSQRASHMFGHCDYSVVCTPQQEPSVFQLRSWRLLPFGLLHLAGSWALRVAPNLLCVVVVVELLLQVVPPAMGLFLQPLLL